MARVLGLFPAALSAARGGMSANAFYRQQQALGVGGRRAEVLELFKIAKSIVVRAPDEPFRDFEAVPTGNELTPWVTKKATGVAQTVTITYRDRTTGKLKQTWWRTVTETGISRERAAAMAIAAYSAHADSYDQDLIGAVHTSSSRLLPFEGE